ncbi:MAG: c-type cytochrome [Gemmatimonadaceae bacterium]
MSRIRILALVACAAIVFPVLTIGAQNQGPPGPPEPLKNLKYFPKNIPRRALLDTMETFTKALGVGCEFCHVTGDEPGTKRDFSLDTKQTKIKARTMLHMVAAINGEYLTKLPSRLQPPIVVSCATCHHGLTEPRQLQQVVLTAYDSAGPDSAMTLYRNLRTRYYGSGSYDFGVAPLTEVGETLQQRSRTSDALKFYMLNLEFAPTSGPAWSAAAAGQLASGDTAAAIKSYEKAVSLNPKDRRAARALQMLQPKPKP